MDLKFYFDSNGDPRARCPARYDLLGQFLESDIQGSVDFCREILEKVVEITKGIIDYREVTFNAHTLVLFPRTACIEPLFGDASESLKIPIVQFKQVLEDWKTFLISQTGDGEQKRKNRFKG